MMTKKCAVILRHTYEPTLREPQKNSVNEKEQACEGRSPDQAEARRDCNKQGCEAPKYLRYQPQGPQLLHGTRGSSEKASALPH